MDPTCGLADKIRDLVFDLIWKQLLYLVHYHRNIELLNVRLDELNLERSSLQHRIDEAINNTDKIEENVLHWLHEVDEISQQVHKLHRHSQKKLECGITSCANPWLRYKLSKRAKTIAQEAVKIYGKKDFHRVSYHVPPQSMPELTNRESNEGIDSRVQIKNRIMEALRNQRFNMIGLCGLGGVGKTTIAKDIGKEEKNQKVFKKVIMATVSQEMNIGLIQDQIIEKLGMQLNEKTEEVKASRLYVRLENEKNMLLILDDLWQELDLLKIGIPFADAEKYRENNEGCKILLTSRNKPLLSESMKCQKIFTVGVLLEDEACELFQSIVKLSIESSSPELKSIATKIVQKCGGLPLAIVTAAKALKGKNIVEWRDYLRRLEHPLTRSFTGIKEVDTILKLSYEPLSRENKDIFLLSAMLSHDPSIDDLLMYSVGLDILEGIENMEDAHVGVSVIVRKLKSLNLFLDSISSHHFTMHDVFRDVALSIASEELNAVIVRHRRLNEWPDEFDLQCCKGICLQESDICDLPEELHGPILEFIFLNSKKSDLIIPHMFFKSLKKLKVLAITNVRFLSLSLLSFLPRLKALCLHSCLLEDISEIRGLKKLKVLSLAYSKIQQLPVEVAELTSLQILNLSHCSELKMIPQKLLSSLKKLEVLYMRNSFNQWKVEESCEADENASLDELTDLPISSLEIHIPNLSMLPKNLFLKMNLRRYIIFIGKRWKWQGNYETSKTLKLELKSTIFLTAGLRELLKGVDDLHLYGSDGQENVLSNLDVNGFPCLKHLQIENNDDIKYIVSNLAHHEDAFPILERLILTNLKALKNLCEGPDDMVFHQLHTLKMKNLPALTGDFSIKNRATKNASNEISKSLFNMVLFPNLEILELSNLNNLIALIWDDQLLHNSFSNLKTLMVISCGFVKLVPLHVMRFLKKLKELEVRDCHMLEMVFDFENLNDYKEMESASVVVPIKKLKLEALPKLKNVWSEHYQRNFSFPCLKSVDVYNCESLTSIFPASLAKGMLCDLEELQILKCGVDVIVARDQVSEFGDVTFEFPSLTSLMLVDLPKLRNFYPQKHTLEWPHLNQLSIRCCDELEIFEKEVSCSSEIYEEENILDSKYPLLSHNKVIGNLEKLTLQGKEVEMIGSGQFLMYHFPKLKLLYLSLRKEYSFSYPQLGELKLSGNIEKALGGDNVAALVARFPKLTIDNISIMGSLSLSLISSSNLTHLNVKWCGEWTTLMTSSVARSLVHLTHLSVGECYKMEEIVTKQEGEDDENKEITFIKLKFLKLQTLPRLKRFCAHNYTFRFLLLDQLVINVCPKFRTFSPGLTETPCLKNVQLAGRDLEKHGEICDTDLNKTLYIQRYVTSRRLVLDEDDAIMIRNDQFPADCCPQVEILGIKGFVEEWVTFPYALLVRFPKLNALYVENCLFEEIFPSRAPSFSSFHNLTVLKVSKCHQLVYLVTCSIVKSLVNLEKLEVSNCDKLEMVFGFEDLNDYPGEMESSLVVVPLNLTHLEVNQCHRLTNLMMSSTAQSSIHITHLSISNCDQIEEVITKLEGEDDKDREIIFNQMKFLELANLPRLKRFCGHNYTLRFPLLEHVTITHCPRLTMFCLGAIHAPQLQSIQVSKYGARKDIWMTDLNYTIQHLFTFEEVISTTQRMVINAKNIIMIMDVFPNVSSLYVESFMDEGVTFPYSSLKRFPMLYELHVEHCSFEEIFPSQDEIIDFIWKIPPFKALYIACLGKLKSIWKNDSQLPLIHQNLEVLDIKSCCSLLRFAPSSASFKDLWRLSVSGCHQLNHLVTTSTAKSLVSLVRLEINDCKKMEEIVMNDNNEDAEQGGITFNELWKIKLTDLPCLKMFSSQTHTFELLELEKIKINGCPKMKMFCPGELKTPMLSKVKIEEHGIEWKGAGDLNKTIEMLSSTKENVDI